MVWSSPTLRNTETSTTLVRQRPCRAEGPRDARKAREVTLLRTNFRGPDMTASSVVHSVGKHPSAKEERKLRKPLIERKRRERINNCLDQLKKTVVGAFRLDQSKLEKADILEMTVQHLQNIQKSSPSGKKMWHCHLFIQTFTPGFHVLVWC
uniref:Hairy-related 8.2 n=1 Tax=Neogobius melanostomus TaxID=47308 RepID=A0A8C6UQP4_9GOBI